MGVLRNRKIIQSRTWIDPEATGTPTFDYDYTYPITTYDAVHRTVDDDSTTLTDELESLREAINSKQNKILGGEAGDLMVWSGVDGQISSMDVTKAIAANAADRSHSKIPTEKAIGTLLDSKASASELNDHINDLTIHITSNERTRWNNMVPMSTLNTHTTNSTIHVTADDKLSWNEKADETDLEAHTTDLNNPHNVTAHQINAYTTFETDAIISGIKRPFFKRKGIRYIDGEASFEDYEIGDWDPNFILAFDDVLPTVGDTATYFALKAVSDYTLGNSLTCSLYIKEPDTSWALVNTINMSDGDMVIAMPDTTVYVWVDGRFMLLSGSGASGNSGIWYPTVSDAGIISWAKSETNRPPDAVNIKGADGTTPVKGVDYTDGADGIGVPVGGYTADLMIKRSNESYDTGWKSLNEILTDWVAQGNVFPEGIINWTSIVGRPVIYSELGNNTNGVVTQAALNAKFNSTDDAINELQLSINALTNLSGDLSAHLIDTSNPHSVTPAQIGAVSVSTFTDHTTDYNNPHQVTKAQVGLSNVDNTTDLDKPISTRVQTELTSIFDELDRISGQLTTDAANCIKSITWSNATSSLQLTYRDNHTATVSIPLADTFRSIAYDSQTHELVFTLPDNSEIRIDVSDLITVYTGTTSSNIQVTVSGDQITANLLDSSVGSAKIASSVALAGSPTTTTQSVTDRSTKIATTAFVAGQVIDSLTESDVDRPLSAKMGKYLNDNKVDEATVRSIISSTTGLTVVDNLLSSSDTAALSANMGRVLNESKADKIHTSSSGSTYGVASSSLFGHTRASEVTPLMDGTAAIGTDNGRYARADHVHPSDISRALASDLTAHTSASMRSENGVHELRYYNGSLDVKDQYGEWQQLIESIRMKATSYSKGDIVHEPSLPLWAELECIIAGSTSSSPLSIPSLDYSTEAGYTGVCIGQQVIDGTVTWAVRAKRVHLLKDVPTPFAGSFFNVVPSGGGTAYSVPIHNELGIPMLDCRFCDGTNGTVDMKDRFIMGKTSTSTSDEYSGTNTYTLQIDNLPTTRWTVGIDGTTTNSGRHNHGGLELNNTNEGLDSYGYAIISAQPGRGFLMTSGQVSGYGYISTPVNLNLWRPAQLCASASKNNKGDYIVSAHWSEHSHGLSASGYFKLNTGSQSSFSLVSAHYKMAYIQRIY